VTTIRERQHLRTGGGNRSGNVIELNLGEVAATRIRVTMDSKSAIISIGDRAMVRAPASTVKAMIASQDKRPLSLDDDAEDNNEYYQEFQDYTLPGCALDR